MQKTLILLVIGLILIGFGCKQAEKDGGSKVVQTIGPEEHGYVKWKGPGWYYGIRFYHEDDYLAWRARRKQRYRQRDRYYYRTYPRGYYPHGPQRGRGRRR